MKQQTVKGALKELKGQVLHTWEALADQELKKAKNNVSELSEHFQHKFDTTKDQVSEKINQLFSRFNAGFENEPTGKDVNSSKNKH